MISALVSDLRYTVRTLLKAPSFTAAALATIALAVGSIAATFAVVDNVLLRPLPFNGSDRVVALCETNAAMGQACGSSPLNVADWVRASTALETAGVARTESFVMRSDSGPQPVRGAVVTRGFFDVLEIEAAAGRLIEDSDLPRGSNTVVVVSHAFWQQQMGRDRAAVGRSLILDGTPFIVAGVLPANAWMPDPYSEVQIWKPLTASVDDVGNRGWRGFTALGRVAPEVTPDKLLAELAVIRERLAAAYPEANRDWGLRIVDLREQIVGNVRSTLLIFLGTACFVLLIACANVAGLLLVRASRRAPEFAVRAALGAGRRRLVQQLMTESVVLASCGAVVGLLLAIWATTAFTTIAPPGIPRLTEVRVDLRVVVVAMGLSMIVALVFGLAAGRRAWRGDLNEALKGSRTTTGSDQRLRSALAVVQLAVALMLVFGAALITRSYMRLTHWEAGFDRSNVITTWMLPPRPTGGQPVVPLMNEVRNQVAALPGVLSAGLGSAGPLFGGSETGDIAVEGRAPFSRDKMPTVEWFDVDPHYFETLGMKVVSGRGFAAEDVRTARPVAVVNETLARQFFPAESPLGRRVTVEEHPAEIVGVVADVRPIRPDQPVAPQIYWPIEQFPRGAAYLVLKVQPGMTSVENSVRARVASVSADIQLSRFVTIDERFSRTLISPRFNALLIGAFAAIAVVLSIVGVYGVVAYGVACRTREFGVRLALGATPHQIVRSVIGNGARLGIVGTVLGVTGALGLGHVLSSIVYGLPTRDPVTLGVAAVALTLTVLAASWAPARRASRVDPTAALRAE